MVTCPTCAAKFASIPELERRWLERHIARTHESRIRHVEPAEPRAA